MISILMVYRVFFLLFLIGSVVSPLRAASSTTKSVTIDSSFQFQARSLYDQIKSAQFTKPKFESFEKALQGFYVLQQKGLLQKNVLTLIDFSLSSNKKRLWVIDLTSKVILFQSLVAHGRNTGEEFANRFSNQEASFMSSFGFYLTGEVYFGKHGLSLKLDGLEKGVNDLARKRAVVMHGANYVSNSFIALHKRLGRSLGCPAIPEFLSKEIISAIQGKSCLFIYHPSQTKFNLS